MNKFLQLAEDIEDDLRELDNDADVLNERRLMIKERARIATNAHHSTYNTIESGLSRLEDAAAGLGGRKNSKDEKKPEDKVKNGEGSDVTSESFQGKTDG